MPSWNCTRSSSTHVTSAGLSCEMDDTIAEWGCSPSVSTTVCSGPKSQNTVPHTPRMSARMSAGRSTRPWSTADTAAASFRVWSQRTTAL